MFFEISEWVFNDDTKKLRDQVILDKGMHLGSGLSNYQAQKGIWWMPWLQEAMKDVIGCEKLRGGANTL